MKRSVWYVWFVSLVCCSVPGNYLFAWPAIDGELVDEVDWSHDGRSWTDDEPKVLKLQSVVDSPFIYGLVQNPVDSNTDVSFIFEYNCETNQITRVRRFPYNVWDIFFHPDNGKLYSIMSPISYRRQIVEFDIDSFSVGEEFADLRTPSGYGITANRLGYGGPGKMILQSIGNGYNIYTPSLLDIQTKQILNDRDMDSYGGLATRDGITFFARHYSAPDFIITKFVWNGATMVEAANFTAVRKGDDTSDVVLDVFDDKVYFDRYVFDWDLNEIGETSEMIRLTEPSGDFLFGITKVIDSNTQDSGLFLPNERDQIVFNPNSSMLVAISNGGTISRVRLEQGAFLAKPIIITTKSLPDGVRLIWEDFSLEEGFEVQYRKLSRTWSTASDLISANTEEFFVPGLEADTDYEIRLRSFDSSGVSGWAQITVRTASIGGLETPQIVETDFASQILSEDREWKNMPRIHWRPVEGATEYWIERRLEGQEWMLLSTVGGEETAFFDDWLPAGQTVAYRLRAASEDAYSNISATAEMYLSGSFASPSSPGTLVVIAGPSGAPHLSWDSSVHETSIFVQRLENDVWRTIATLEPEVTEYIDTSAEPNTDYTYRIGVFGRRFVTLGGTNLYTEASHFEGDGTYNGEDYTPLIALISNPGPTHSSLSKVSTFDPITSGLYFRAPDYDIVVERIGAVRVVDREDHVLLGECVVGIYDSRKNLLYAQTFEQSDLMDSSGFFLWKETPKIILRAGEEYILATYTAGSSSVYSLPLSLAGVMDPMPSTNLSVDSRWYTGGGGSDSIEFPSGSSSLPYPTVGGNLEFRPLVANESLEEGYIEGVARFSSLALDLEQEQFSFNASLHTAYQLFFSPDLNRWEPRGALLRGPLGAVEGNLPDAQGAGKGFYRLRALTEFTSVFLDKDLADYVISDGFATDSSYEVTDNESGGQSGSFVSSSLSDGVRINIYGVWRWLLNEDNVNTAVFTSTVNRIEVPSLGFEGTPFQYASRFGEAVAYDIHADIEYTGFGVGIISELESLTNGSEIQGAAVSFDLNTLE